MNQFKKKREWIWFEDMCLKCLAKKKYDPKTNTLTCPRCGGVNKFTYGPEVFSTLSEVIYGFPPHKYLYEGLSAEEIAGMFLRKLDKRDWNIWLSHDYVLAKLRGDGERQERMREAVRTMATRMDYDVDDCMTLFPDILNPLEKSADLVPHALYDIAERHLRVEGWRVREEERVYEGKKRIQYTPEVYGEGVANAFFREKRMWELYNNAVEERYYAYRVEGDRVACWVTRELLAKLFYNMDEPSEVYQRINDPGIDADPYPDNLIEDVLEGRGDPDPQETAVQWHMRTANMILGIPDEGMEEKGYYAEDYAYDPRPDAVEDMVLAVAARLGWKTIPYKPFERYRITINEEDYARKFLIDQDDYARKLAEKLNDTEIWSLYNKARYGDLEIPRGERVKIAKKLLTKTKVILSVLPPAKKPKVNPMMYT